MPPLITLKLARTGVGGTTIAGGAATDAAPLAGAAAAGALAAGAGCEPLAGAGFALLAGALPLAQPTTSRLANRTGIVCRMVASPEPSVQAVMVPARERGAG
jgi:hypothetical protein